MAPFDDTMFLKNIDVLSFFNEEQLRRVTPDIERREYKAGQTVILRGEISSGFYILKKGRALARYQLPSGPAELELKAGDFFGVMSMLGDAASDASVKALEDDTTVLTIPSESFTKLLQLQPLLKKLLLDKSAARRKSLGPGR